MESERLISVLATFGIALLWSVARILQGTWVGPGGVLCWTWLLFAGAPLVLAADVPAGSGADLTGFVFVLLGVMTSSIPVVVVRSRGTVAAEPAPQRTHLLSRIYYVGLGLGCAAPVLLQIAAIRQFGFTGWSDLVRNVTDARYLGFLEVPGLVTVLPTGTYIAALVGGFIVGAGLAPKGQVWRYLLWGVPLFAQTMIQTTRASVAYGAVLFLCAFLAARISQGTDRSLRLTHLVSVGPALFGGAFAFNLFGQLVRWRSFEPAHLLPGFEKVRVLLTGHMYLFNAFLEGNEQAALAEGEGGRTFAGLAQLAGFGSREIGLGYAELDFPNGWRSNLYTAFRPMIEDGTLAGALLGFFLLFLIAGIGHAAVLRGSPGGVGLMAPAIVFALWSPVTSIFAYNSILLAFLVFGVLIALWAYRDRARPEFTGAPEDRRDELCPIEPCCS